MGPVSRIAFIYAAHAGHNRLFESWMETDPPPPTGVRGPAINIFKIMVGAPGAS
jgi:hypothetical protein